MSFEIRQGGIPCLWRWCAAILEKQSHMSHETDDFETYETAGSGAGFQALEAEVTTF